MTSAQADLVGQVEARAVTDAEVAFFRENGWVRLKSLVSESGAATLLDSAKGVLGPTGTTHRGREGVDVGFDWWNDYHFPSREGIEPFTSLSRSRAMALNAQRFLGRPIGIRHFADMIGARAPVGTGDKDSETTYHQDYPGGQFDRTGNIVFWFALNDLPPERGVMRFLSGAQREGSLGYRPPDLFDRYPHLLERYELSEPMHLSPGDATVHGQYTFHGSPANSTNEPRWHYSTIYIPTDMRWTGARFHGRDLVDLTERGLFDHESFPQILEDPTDDGKSARWHIVGKGQPIEGGWALDIARANRVRRVRVDVADADAARAAISFHLDDEEPPTHITNC